MLGGWGGAGGDQGETSNTGRVIAFTLQARSRHCGRRQGSGRPGIPLEALVTLTRTFSAPNCNLPSADSLRSPAPNPHFSLTPPPPPVLCTHLEQTLPKAQEPSEMITGGGGVNTPRVSHASDGYGLGARGLLSRRDPAGTGAGAAGRSWPPSGGLQSLGEKDVPGRETEPEREKTKGAVTYSLNLVSKPLLPKRRGNPFRPAGGGQACCPGKASALSSLRKK